MEKPYDKKFTTSQHGQMYSTKKS